MSSTSLSAEAAARRTRQGAGRWWCTRSCRRTVALDRRCLEIIAPYLRNDILCLGYPDLLPAETEVAALLNITPSRFIDLAGEHRVRHRVVETVQAFRDAGAGIVVDRGSYRGCERIVDLNYRQAWPRRYGLVIDPGTTEHCFYVAEAILSAWRAVDVGGHLFSCPPLSMMNHGFWNFSPTVFVDFLEDNGGALVTIEARDVKTKAIVPIEPHRRFPAPGNAVLYVLARKTHDVPEKIPTQRVYR